MTRKRLLMKKRRGNEIRVEIIPRIVRHLTSAQIPRVRIDVMAPPSQIVNLKLRNDVSPALEARYGRFDIQPLYPQISEREITWEGEGIR